MTAQKVTRAELRNTVDRSQVLACQFNPESLTRTKSADWTKTATQQSTVQPNHQFVSHGSESLSANLLFDEFDRLGDQSTNVKDAIDLLISWLTIQPGDQQRRNSARPPAVEFKWGQGIHFVGVLKQVSIQYLMFSPNGHPLRATASIYLQATPDDPKPTNPTSGGTAGRATERFDEGESLPSIAYKHYGDPNLWRAIAISNDIDDPGRIPLGTRLLVPRLTDAIALSDGGAGNDQ